MKIEIKGWNQFDAALERAIAANKGAAGLVIADATKRLLRIAERAEEMEGEWEQLEMVQNRGPTVKFTGRQLAADGFETKDERYGGMEIWETRAGALVALSYIDIPTGGEDRRVAVIERSDDVRAMQRAVLDAFSWDNRAKSMVRDQLDWDLSVEID